MGLLDDLGAFIKTPAGIGLLSAVAGGAMGARRGTPWNNLGRGATAGLMGYQSANESADAAVLKKFQLDKLTADAKDRQTLVDERQTMQGMLAGTPETFGYNEDGTVNLASMDAGKPPADNDAMAKFFMQSIDPARQTRGFDMNEKNLQRDELSRFLQTNNAPGFDPNLVSQNPLIQKSAQYKLEQKDKAEQKAIESNRNLEGRKEMQAIIDASRQSPPGSDISKLISERAAMFKANPNNPNLAVYDAAIKGKSENAQTDRVVKTNTGNMSHSELLAEYKATNKVTDEFTIAFTKASNPELAAQMMKDNANAMPYGEWAKKAKGASYGGSNDTPGPAAPAPAATAPAPAPNTQPATQAEQEVTTQAQFDSLPKGAIYLENGKRFRKP